jgi:hypothetical protein
MFASRKSGSVPQLRWFHPEPLERYHELRGADGKVASVRWAKERGTLATAQWGSESWTFKRFGFLHPKITIRQPHSDVNMGRFDPDHSGGGLLHLADGLEFRLLANFWRGEWRWVDPAGADLLEFKRDFSVAEKNEGHITWVADGVDPGRLHLLTLLGWYVVIMLAEDASQPFSG